MSNRTTSANANADALFANRTLDEIRDVEARTRKEANEKAEALRTLLSDSYKDAISTLEAIDTIDATTKEIAEVSKEILAALERMGNATTSGVEENAVASRDGEARTTAIARGSRVKFLLDTPEKIWGLLEDCDYALGAQRLMAAVDMLGALTSGSAMAEMYGMFPVLRQQSIVLSSFKAHVSKRARSGLERPGLRSDEATSALRALLAVENLSTSQALTLLLQMRRAWVRACLRDIASSVTTQDTLNKRLSGLIEDIKRVVKLAFDVFAGEESLLAKDSHADTKMDNLFHGVFEPKADIERFKIVTHERRKTLDILSASAVSEACRVWLDALAGDIKKRGVAVFGKISNCRDLATLENTLSSEDPDWNDACITIFNRKISLWSALFEQPWLHQGFALFKMSLSFSQTKPLVDAALADSAKKASSDSRKDSSVWSSASSKDASLNIPEDVKCACAVASTLNKVFLSVRKDALMLQGVQLGGSAELEGRFVTLAEHIQTCAHKSLVDLAQYLSLQNKGNSLDVTRALMVGHLAKAVTSGVKETNVLLKPANLWPKYNENAELIIKPPKTLRSDQKAKEPENAKIKNVTDELQSAMNAGFKVWVDDCTTGIVRRFKEALSTDDVMEADDIPSHWEEVSAGKVDDSLSLRLPATISSYVLSALHGALQEAQRIGGHLLPISAIQMLASSLADAMLKVYEDSTARTRLSEKGTLQLLLDVRFVSDVLAQNATERVEALQKQLTSELDPIDWATYEPHLWENERRAYRRSSVLLGGFIQFSNLYQDTSVKPASGLSPAAANVKPVARFSYLPVSLPTLRGSATVDRTKGKIDWGDILPDSTDDEEREGLLSSFMQSSRIGLGNILREFA